MAAEFDAGFHVHVAEAESDQPNASASMAGALWGASTISAFSAARPSQRTVSMSTISRSTCSRAARPLSFTTPSPTWAMPWVTRRCSRWSAVACAWAWAATRTPPTCSNRSRWQTCCPSTRPVSRERAGPSRRRCCSTATLNLPAPVSAALGTLIPGALADLIVVDYDPPTPITACNINSHILFGVSGRAVRTTIIGGRIVMLDRELPGIDEAGILAEARAARPKALATILILPQMPLFKGKASADSTAFVSRLSKVYARFALFHIRKTSVTLARQLLLISMVGEPGLEPGTLSLEG